MEPTAMEALFTAMNFAGLSTNATTGLTAGITLGLLFVSYKVIKRIMNRV